MTEFIAALAGLVGRVDLFWLTPLVVVVLAHFLAEPSRWRVYLHRHTGIAWSGLLQVFSLTALVGYVLPAKLGLPMRLLLLRSRFGLTMGAISTLLMLDGLLYYACWAVAALAGLPWAVGMNWGDGRAMALMAATLFGATLLLLVLLRHPDRLPFGLATRLKSVQQYICVTLDSLRGWPLYATAVITALDIASHVLRHGVLLAMFGYQLPLAGLYATTTLSIFAGLISLMPMGLGGYDLVLVLLLQSNGIPLADAVAVAVANRLAGLAVSVGLGAWGGLALGLGAWNRREWTRLAEKAAAEGGREGR
jgi:uncharacterized membrane protein YbhN (UPF0104 family)